MSACNMQILGRHTSFNVQKVLWLADEIGCDYKHTEIGGKYGGNQTAQFLKLNPLGKVPVLVDAENAIWESNTILRYLADSRAQRFWLGDTPYQRSLVNRWLDWSIEPLESAFVGVFWGYYRTPPEQRDETAIAESVVRYESCLEALNNQLADQPFLLGAKMSLADIATGVFLHRLYSIDIDILYPEGVTNWYQRLTSRPGYAKWVMSDFTELKGRTAY